MAATYELIASTTLGSNSATFSFSSIQADYTDLVLVGNWKASNAASMEIRVNSDTGSNYSMTFLLGRESTAGSFRASNNTLLNTNIYGAANGDVVGFFHFMSYANTNVYKTILCGGGSAGQIVGRHVGLWRSTAAINSLSFSIFSGVTYTAGSTFSLYGIKSAALVQGDGVQATGGDEVYLAGGFKHHVFKSSGTLTVTQGGDVEYLVVAGGGGGGSAYHAAGGGGGAGGLNSTTATVSAQEYVITIGGGGSGGISANGSGGQGSDGSTSSFGSLDSATGGGGGGSGNLNSGSGGVANGRNGGSGGGAGGRAGTTGGTGTSGQGNNGGNRRSDNSGGGGGAGAAGGDAGASTGGAAGAGSSVFGSTYAAGGTGVLVGGSAEPAGAANTGNGGGPGAGTGQNGAAGGSGIVIVRYPI